LNAAASPNTARREKGATKKKKTNPPQTTKKVPFQNIKSKKNKTCETFVTGQTSSRRYSKHTTKEGVATERERESTLTAIHSCHRPRIPFGHVLIERRCVSKHCNRGCNKEKRDQPTTNNKKGTVSKPQKNKTCEKCDPMKFESA